MNLLALITISATPDENLSPQMPLFSDAEVFGLASCAVVMASLARRISPKEVRTIIVAPSTCHLIILLMGTAVIVSGSPCR